MMLRGFLLILSFWVFHMTKSEQIAHRVSVCPRSKAEWQKASKRMNCSEDYIDPTNRYHCLPDDRLTTLLEFCYSQRRAQVVKGLCMVFVESKNIVTHYNCSRFKEECPNAVYYTDEMYKVPACTEIDPIQHCYKAEPSCQQKPPLSTVVEDTATLTTSFTAPTIETNKEENSTLAVALPVTFGLLVLIICIVVWRMTWRKRRSFGLNEKYADEMRHLLTPEERDKLEKIEADIKRSKIDYLLQELPSDQKLFPLIAKLLKIPQEILYWSPQNRRKFVSSMNTGTISVYIGRGMVIGCTGAGKTTLVKKLKGERNLNTEETSGIEIHTHVFKLNANESTITDCSIRDQKKGCVCLTPITLTKSTETVENKEERFLSDVSEEGVPNNSIAMSPLLKQTPFHNESHDGMSKESHDGNSPSNSRISEERAVVADEEGISRSNLATDNLPFENDLSQEVEESNIESEQTIDFSYCTASVNEKNLKMFSLLDFAGHSAYYACHHIFFSRRAFFILVVDMKKEFKRIANNACPHQNLIYSNWTYEDYIRYWLGSIHTYSSKTAPVILVASHAEGCTGDPKKARKFFVDVLDCLPEVLQNHVDKDRVFLIEKEKKENVENLRKCIASLGKSQSHWGENIPIAWAKLESVLKKLQEGSKIYPFHRLLKDVQKTNDLSINNEEELITALTFFHETGVILFRSEIKNIIILDVQWFVNALKCIILEEDHVSITDKHNLKKFKELNKVGLLSRDLLNILWEKDNFNQYQDDLINHIMQLDILARLSEHKWYVPCMNKQTYFVETLKDCEVSSTLCFLFEFLPFVIFHRLVVACINNLEMKPWRRSQKMCIFHKVAILICDDQTHRVLIGICENKDTDYPYSIEIQTNVTKPRKVDNHLSSNLKGEICKILTDLTRAFPSCERSFKVGYRCHVKPFSGIPDDYIIREENILKSEVDCTKCQDNHIVNVGSIKCFWKENTDPYQGKNEGENSRRSNSQKPTEPDSETVQDNGQHVEPGEPEQGTTASVEHSRGENNRRSIPQRPREPDNENVQDNGQNVERGEPEQDLAVDTADSTDGEAFLGGTQPRREDPEVITPAGNLEGGNSRRSTPQTPRESDNENVQDNGQNVECGEPEQGTSASVENSRGGNSRGSIRQTPRESDNENIQDNGQNVERGEPEQATSASVENSRGRRIRRSISQRPREPDNEIVQDNGQNVERGQPEQATSASAENSRARVCLPKIDDFPQKQHRKETQDDTNPDRIVVTTYTKVFPTSEVKVSQELYEQGRHILNPSPAPIKTVEEAMASPPKIRVSVEGKVVQVEAVKEVKEERVKVKNILIEDSTSKCNVALWGTLADEEIRAGDYVYITDVVTTNFRNEISLQTTYRTKICVFPTSEVKVSQELYEQGRHILNPSPAPIKTVEEAMASPPKIRVSVEGKVVQVEAVKEVKEERVKVKNILIEDSTSKCNVALWGTLADEEIRAGDYVYITDVVTTNFRNEISLQTTYRTKICVFPTSEVKVSQELYEQGRHILNPSPAPIKTVEEAMASPPKIRVSVEGKVVQVEAVKEVKEERVKVKNILIEDRTSKCNVALWGTLADEEIRAGDYVYITDVVTTNFRKEISLQTTYRTKICVSKQYTFILIWYPQV